MCQLWYVRKTCVRHRSVFSIFFGVFFLWTVCGSMGRALTLKNRVWLA
jgi:hypothetical protein